MTFYFECKHKFGSVTATDKEEAKIKVRNKAWCEGRCSTCKLKVTSK